jgi:hypothetical protein
MLGNPDYIALVAVTDIAAYEQFMTGRVATLPGLGSFSSAMKKAQSPKSSRRVMPHPLVLIVFIVRCDSRRCTAWWPLSLPIAKASYAALS